MNDKILNCCDEISLLLKQNDIIISYLKIRDEITSNKDFIKKINEMNYYKKCANIEENEDSIKIYNEVNSSLIYTDYLNKKEQASNLIDEMKEIIKR